MGFLFPKPATPPPPPEPEKPPPPPTLADAAGFQSQRNQFRASMAGTRATENTSRGYTTGKTLLGQ